MNTFLKYKPNECLKDETTQKPINNNLINNNLTFNNEAFI